MYREKIQTHIYVECVIRICTETHMYRDTIITNITTSYAVRFFDQVDRQVLRFMRKREDRKRCVLDNLGACGLVRKKVSQIMSLFVNIDVRSNLFRTRVGALARK